MSTETALQSDAGPLWQAADTVAIEPDPSTFVTFELAGQVFAVDVAHVREVLDMQPIARLPNADGDVLGMIDVRGESIAVIDLPSRLGMMRGDCQSDARIVVMEMPVGDDRPPHPFGVIADRVLSVVEIAPAGIEPAPAALNGRRSPALTGVARTGGVLTMVLDLGRLFGGSDDFDFQ